MYLTHTEYQGLGFTSLEETEFNRLLPKASDVVDNVTRYFYMHNDLESDVKFRRDQFKKAVAAQIEYFHDMGATNSHGINEPSNVTIGRTTLNEGNSSNTDRQNALISKDVYFYLRDTGLLYKGIGVV